MCLGQEGANALNKVSHCLYSSLSLVALIYFLVYTGKKAGMWVWISEASLLIEGERSEIKMWDMGTWVSTMAMGIIDMLFSVHW